MATPILTEAQRNSASTFLQETWIGNYPFLDKIRDRIVTRGGERIEQPFLNNTADVYSFSKRSEVDATQKGEIVKGVLDWGTAAYDDEEYGWDMENQGAVDSLTSGTLYKLYDTRVKMGHSLYHKRVNERLWLGAGTPYNSADGDALDYLGVESWISTTPTSGNIIELSRSANPFMQNKELDGATDGTSQVWANDCWELIFEMNELCSDYPREWGGAMHPDMWFGKTAQIMSIITLGLAQNTNVGADVNGVISLGGIKIIKNDAQTAGRIYALNSGSWTLYRPPGVNSFMELDVRSDLEARMNRKDTIFIWKSRGALACTWLPANGVITNAA